MPKSKKMRTFMAGSPMGKNKPPKMKKHKSKK